MTDVTAERDLDAIHRRTVRVLVGGQVFGAMGVTVGIATASLLAKELSGSERLAGLAQTFQVLGAAVASYFLAGLMSRRGRRVGLSVGYLLGAAGSVIAVLAGVLGSMPVLLLGAVLLGSTSAAGLGARYAATDLAPEATRGRSLSVVVWATTIGAVAGPNLTTLSSAVARALSIPTLTGPFALGAVSMLVAAAVLWVLLRPDPLLLARTEAGQTDSVRHGTSWGRVGEVVREQPLVGAAITGLAAAHAVMVGVMVMTPLHMQHGHSELRVIGLVISVHVLGMFALAPVMGWAADRFGRVRLMAAGGVVLLASLLLAGVSPEGSSWQIFAGLFLLGLGWSAVMVAASTLLTTHVPLDARTDVQGASDMTMNIAAAGSAGLAGFLVDAWGYPQLNLFAAVLATVVLASAALARSREPAR